MVEWPTVVVGVLCLLCAAALGSFATVLVHRLPIQIVHADDESRATFNIAVPGSHCPSCQTPLRWWQNMPLLGFILLRGRCAFCQTPIPRRYFWIELGVVVLAWACWLIFGLNGTAVAAFTVVYLLWVLSWIDALHGLLPDVLTLGLLWMGLLARAWFAPFSLVDGVLGAALGYVLLWLPYVLYLHWRGIAGLGLGDAKLLAGLGAWLGLLYVPYVLLLSSVLGLLYGGARWILRADASDRLGALRMAFGPFISVAALVVALWYLKAILAGWGIR